MSAPLLLATCLLAPRLPGQTAAMVKNVATPSTSRLAAPAALPAGVPGAPAPAPPPPPAQLPNRNPYIGAQIGYGFAGGEFASNIVAAGSVLYDVVVDDPNAKRPWHFFIPVRGNIAPLLAAPEKEREKKAADLLTSAQGMRIGIEPYFDFEGSRVLHPTLFGAAGWKLNAVKDAADTTRYLAMGRFAAGGELGIGARDGERLPITVSASFVYSLFSDKTFQKVFGNSKSSVRSGEFTFIIPVGRSSGLLSEAIVSDLRGPVWRIGLIFVGQNGS